MLSFLVALWVGLYYVCHVQAFVNLSYSESKVARLQVSVVRLEGSKVAGFHAGLPVLVERNDAILEIEKLHGCWECIQLFYV